MVVGHFSGVTCLVCTTDLDAGPFGKLVPWIVFLVRVF